jgi:hypothetical protein
MPSAAPGVLRRAPGADLEGLGLSAEDQHAVFAGNAQRVQGIQAPDVERALN